ncbi:MAG: DUF86 domain-containing protein [Acidimicrobiia bacterium]|nr:DUF86 domain-containing protein [Acidimicrobiia bacterium]
MRDDAARVLDIIETCDQLLEHVGSDRTRFESDPVVQAAAQRWLEIIGEAASRLTDGFRAERPDVPWRDLVGMRNILAHGYFHIDNEVVWAAISRDIPVLRRSLIAASEVG